MALTSETKRLVLERDGWQCRMPVCYCPAGRAIDPALWGSQPEWWAPTVDHIRRRARGGGNAMANLRAAHDYCNRRAAQPATTTLYDRLPLQARIGLLALAAELQDRAASTYTGPVTPHEEDHDDPEHAA